jgi:hypothetical protein
MRDHETHTERDAARFETDRDHGPDLDGREEDGIPWDNPRRVVDPVGVLGDAIRLRPCVGYDDATWYGEKGGTAHAAKRLCKTVRTP